MLGTLSEPRRGRMSHICDISALRVNNVILTLLVHLLQYQLHLSEITDTEIRNNG